MRFCGCERSSGARCCGIAEAKGARQSTEVKGARQDMKEKSVRQAQLAKQAFDNNKKELKKRI